MELSLDLSLAPKTLSLFLGDTCQNLHMLEGFVQRLEDELRKVEAFKRELPLCMLLLNDAISRLKEEKSKCSRMQRDPPLAEEFMPLKTSSGGNGTLTIENQSCDKKNWMSSAQLWSAETKSNMNEEDDRCVVKNPMEATEQKNNGEREGGALSAFKVEASRVPSFSLMTPASESHSTSKSGCGGASSSASSLLRVEVQSQPQPPHHLQHNPRKHRRCWSPELHRRFVDALQQLGGAQVATPKQIREVMQVEGLTNDEVKSHLQKYRLHVRRFPVSSVGEGNNNGLWMRQDECGDKSKGILSQPGSPQGPLLLGGSVKGLSSPGRNHMDPEDEQSDCCNWKSGLHQHHEPDNQSP